MNVLKDAATTQAEKDELLAHLFKTAEKLDVVIVDVVDQANEIKINGID